MTRLVLPLALWLIWYSFVMFSQARWHKVFIEPKEIERTSEVLSQRILCDWRMSHADYWNHSFLTLLILY